MDVLSAIPDIDLISDQAEIDEILYGSDLIDPDAPNEENSENVNDLDKSPSTDSPNDNNDELTSTDTTPRDELNASTPNDYSDISTIMRLGSPYPVVSLPALSLPPLPSNAKNNQSPSTFHTQRTALNSPLYGPKTPSPPEPAPATHLKHDSQVVQTLLLFSNNGQCDLTKLHDDDLNIIASANSQYLLKLRQKYSTPTSQTQPSSSQRPPDDQDVGSVTLGSALL